MASAYNQIECERAGLQLAQVYQLQRIKYKILSGQTKTKYERTQMKKIDEAINIWLQTASFIREGHTISRGIHRETSGPYLKSIQGI
jgi:hypothetical protein